MNCNLQNPKVLILNDDRLFLTRCQSEFHKNGIATMVGDPDHADDVQLQIAQFEPHVIVTGLYINKMDAAQFIYETHRQAGCPHQHFIILSSYNDRNLFRECCEAGAAYCMIEPIDFHFLSERIRKICAPDAEKFTVLSNEPFSRPGRSNLEAQVTGIMQQMGVPAHIRGYLYLRFAILTAVKDPPVIQAITKVLYPLVAREFSVSASRVERAMRHAIEVAWNRGDPDIQRMFFGYTMRSNRGKPTNSEFIAMIADNLRLEHRNTPYMPYDTSPEPISMSFSSLPYAISGKS